MSEMKVTIELTLDSEDARMSGLLLALAGQSPCKCNTVTVPAVESAPVAEPVTEPKPKSKSKPKPKPAPEPEPEAAPEEEPAPAPTPAAEPAPKPAPKPAPAPAPADSEITIDLLRSLVIKIVGSNESYRSVIKDKLTEFGVERVTLLPAEHYKEMYDFLKSL